MKVVHYDQLESAPVETEEAVGCRIRCLIGEPDGAPSFTMRLFEVAPGGHTPKHSHGHEHEVFVLEGSGAVMEGDVEHALRPGTAVFVPPKALHAEESDPRKHYVYVLSKKGEPRKKRVTVGRRTDDKVEILKGLSEGDEVLLEKPDKKKEEKE